MTNIHVVMGRFYRNQFKYNCLKKQSLFVKFSFQFWNLYKLLNILKKDEHHSLSISEIFVSKKRGYLSV